VGSDAVTVGVSVDTAIDGASGRSGVAPAGTGVRATGGGSGIPNG